MKLSLLCLTISFLALPCLATELNCVTRGNVARLTAKVVNSRTLANILLVTTKGEPVLVFQGPVSSVIVPILGLLPNQRAGLFVIGRPQIHWVLFNCLNMITNGLTYIRR